MDTSRAGVGVDGIGSGAGNRTDIILRYASNIPTKRNLEWWAVGTYHSLGPILGTVLLWFSDEVEDLLHALRHFLDDVLWLGWGRLGRPFKDRRGWEC